MASSNATGNVGNTTLPNGGIILGNDVTLAASAGVTGNFNQMLKKYAPYEMMVEEVKKRDYFFSKVNVIDGWKGGQMDISFKSAKASSRRFGKLVNKDEINQAKYALGAITKYKQLWGSMVFYDHDLKRHDSVEQSLIKILPEQLDDFIVGMKEEAGRNFLNNNAIARVLSAPDTDGAAGGVDEHDEADLAVGILKVSRPENFELGQRVDIGTMGTANVNGAKCTGYVQKIDLQGGEILLHTTYAGGTPLDMGSVSVGGASVDVNDGDIITIQDGLIENEVFNSLDNQILSAANGGSANIFGLDKLVNPYTQSFNYDGSGITNGEALIKKIFEVLLLTSRIGKGAPTEAIMSMKLLAGVMSSLQNGLVGSNTSGNVNSPRYFMKDTKTSLYGWTEIEIMGVEGSLKLVGINEMEDDTVKIIDWRGIDLHTNGMFERLTDLDGNQFTTERTDEGLKYITDIRMFGELVVSRPSYQGIIYGIPSTFTV